MRYGQSRRGELADSFLSQAAVAFGLPGTWSDLDVSLIDVNESSGELTLPENLLGVAINEAEITYTSGFATIPAAIKTACAQIVRNAQATPALNVRSSKVDTLEMQYFSGSLIDATVRQLLRPYVAEKVG